MKAPEPVPSPAPVPPRTGPFRRVWGWIIFGWRLLWTGISLLLMVGGLIGVAMKVIDFLGG